MIFGANSSSGCRYGSATTGDSTFGAAKQRSSISSLSGVSP